jgi:xylan 1,4-beta-xylosidase
LPDEAAVDLAMQVDCTELQFFYRLPWDDWRPVGPVLDASVISDEGGRGEHASFTGAFTGMAAFDTSGSAIEADFDRFAYIPKDR